MSLYLDLQGIASGVLKEFNQGVIQLITVTPGNGPVNNPGPSTEVAVTLQGAVAKGVSTKYIMAGLAVASDLQVTMGVTDNPTPVQNGFISVDGVRYKIKQIIKKPAAGDPVVYTLIVEKK